MNRPAKDSIRKSLVAVLIVFALVCVVRAQPQDTEQPLTKDHPLMELDVGKFGYRMFIGSRYLRISADFTDASHVALAWMTPDSSTVPKKNRRLAPEPAHLHFLVIDANMRKVQPPQEWPTPYSFIDFFGVRDGRVLSCTGKTLRLFSPAFVVMRERDLPNNNICRVSPSRRSLLLSSFSGHSYQNEILDLDTFNVLAKWSDEQRTSDISDHWLVGFCGKPSELCLRRIDQSWKPFQPIALDKQMNDSRPKFSFFANDETLVIKAWNEMAVASVEAKVLFQVKLAKNRSFGRLVTSTGGDRFAVIENRRRGVTSPPLDMYAFPSNDRVSVYSIPDRRSIYEVKVKGTSPWTPWKPHDNQLALSPDGTLLAVISDGILRIYRLPDSNAAQH